MKKLLSLLTAVVCLFVFTLSTAQAATLGTKKSNAQEVTLSASVSGTVSNDGETSVEYWAKFTAYSSGYYDITALGTAAPAKTLFVTVYDADSNAVNFAALSSPDLQKVMTTYFTQGKVYYIRCQIYDSTYSFTIGVSIHNHSYTSTVQAPAVADDDAENFTDGYDKTYCPACGDGYVSAVYYAPSSVVISDEKKVYNGYEQTTGIAVYDRAGNYVSPDNYYVTYEDNVNTGKAWLYVNFTGKYKGQLTRSFYIIPQKAAAVSLKSKKASQLTFTWLKDSNASGYEIQYSTSKKFTAKTTKSVVITKKSTKSKTLKSLKKNKKYYVRIRAYKTIDGVRQFGAWSKKLSAKTK